MSIIKAEISLLYEHIVQSFFFFGLFVLLRATRMAYGCSQARVLIGAVATSLHQSHSNVGFQVHLRPTPQLTATPDPLPTERCQGLNPKPHGS